MPYSWFTRNVHTEGLGNYNQADIKTLLDNYKQLNDHTNPHLWLCVGITTMNRFVYIAKKINHYIINSR
jgi:hypothetical protein